jgi:DNA-binding MarR family transcriptional regulator
MKTKKMQTKPKKQELSPTQKAVFDAIVADERASIVELCEQVGASEPTVIGAVRVLEALGLITREPGKARSIRVVEARA